ncbi:MAG TPA: VWA domain-containing protein, partial [Roseiflexaceae bacterium]|nr:VWA domain-containing protein [Roseiflexaceae bacterium]
EIARRAQARSIGITALGIGTEWNEDLLETITASENSRAQYVAQARDVATIFADEVQQMHAVFAQRVRLTVAGRPGVLIRSLDKVKPFIAPVPIIEEQDLHWVAQLGDWSGSESQSFLVEVVVPPLPIGMHPLLKLQLQYDLPAAGVRDQIVDAIVRINSLAAEDVQYQVEPTVKHWLERLVAYRLQAQAWQKAEAGEIAAASAHLKMASTRLLSAGQIALAHMIDAEAAQLSQSGQASEEGRKRIKFGTRGLVGPIQYRQIEHEG